MICNEVSCKPYKCLVEYLVEVERCDGFKSVLKTSLLSFSLEILPLWKRNAGGIAACSHTMDFYLEAITCFYVQNKIR